jgi:CRISPR-associated protein Cas1
LPPVRICAAPTAYPGDSPPAALPPRPARTARERHTAWPAAVTAAAQLAAAAAALDGAANLDALRGHEGAGAAAYFGAWRASLPQSWGFQGRAFHPPPDPVNAALSFGYTLLLNDALTAVHLAGLDPYLGAFHAVEAGRPSLALDLMEPFRPLVVDRVVLELLRDGELHPEQFTASTRGRGGVDLGADGRALLIARYEAAMLAPTRLPGGEQTATRRAVLLQAQAFALAVRGEQAGKG